MKKIYILFLIIFLTGCTNEVLSSTSNEINADINTGIDGIPMYVDDNPITVGLYNNGELVSTLKTKYQDDTDIATFNIIFTNDKKLPSDNLKTNWNTYYKKYNKIDKYKIGFLLEFTADGKEIKNKILDPDAKYKAGPYVFVYLYDGIHQSDGASYTHLEKKDVNSKTIYSSIKLYMSTKTKKIESPIKLTVFTYDGKEDFDEDGNYRGNSKYTITIKG